MAHLGRQPLSSATPALVQWAHAWCTCGEKGHVWACLSPITWGPSYQKRFIHCHCWVLHWWWILDIATQWQVDCLSLLYMEGTVIYHPWYLPYSLNMGLLSLSSVPFCHLYARTLKSFWFMAGIPASLVLDQGMHLKHRECCNEHITIGFCSPIIYWITE